MTCKDCCCYQYCYKRIGLRKWALEKCLPSCVSNFEEILRMFEVPLYNTCPKPCEGMKEK